MLFGIVIAITILSFFISFTNSSINNELTKIKGNKIISTIFTKSDLSDFTSRLGALNKDNDLLLKKTISINEVYVNLYGVGIHTGEYKELSNKLKTNKNSVIIGKGLKKFIKEVDGEKVLEINNVKYNVIHVLSDPECGYAAFISLNDFLENYKESNISGIKFIFISDNLLVDDLMKFIKESKLDAPKINIESEESIDLSLYMYIPVVVVIVAFINICNFSLLWMNRRKKEIALYKAMGATNIKILIKLFKEILLMSFIALIISIMVQFLINYYINKNSLINSYQWIDINNLFYCTIAVLVMSLLSVIPSYISTISIKPVYILKEE